MRDASEIREYRARKIKEIEVKKIGCVGGSPATDILTRFPFMNVQDRQKTLWVRTVPSHFHTFLRKSVS
jgi:tRNA (Thr-GGU) A37 N-methylase